MSIRLILPLTAAALALSILPGHAGPCTEGIDHVQAQVDAKIDATAGAGPSGSQTRAAGMHHQPTPESIAAAEKRLGEGAGVRAALEALARARDADRANDKGACESALAEAQRAIGR
jgi:hypothetical protein